MLEDSKFMQRALELAKSGEGYTSPNPLVGAVVVKDGKVIGEGYHQCYGGPHAEVYALEEAGDRAEGAAIYVNLEPCNHYGKTPPCSLKIIDSGIKRAVIGMKDPNPKVSGQGIQRLRAAGIEVVTGVLEEESKRLNEVFVKYITTDLPFVILKTAQTLDGYLATGSGDSRWITNQEARLYSHQLRHKVDAILVGIGTVLKDNPRLTTRLPGKEGKDSIRIILDSKLRFSRVIDLAGVINNDSEVKTIIVAGERVDPDRKKLIKKTEGLELLTLPLNKDDMIPLEKLLNLLHKRKISSILVEGGGKVNYSFLKSRLIDRVYSFIAPVFLGGCDGIPVFTGKGPEKMADIKELGNVSFKGLGNNMMVTGILQYEDRD